MTKEQKLKVNIAAVELLGYERIVHVKLSSGAVSIKICGNRTRLFNLFTNPADCQAVVKKLGVEKHVGFIPDMNGTWCVVAESTDGKKTVGRVRMYDKTYEEAVGAACLEIKGESDE